MQVPKFLIMLGNRRSVLLRAIIVFNIAVLLYAAMHYSGNSAPGVEWVPITVDGSERSAELRLLKEIQRNETEVRAVESSIPNVEEFTSQKAIPSTVPVVNKTASSTVSDVEKKISAVPSEANTINETIETSDDRVLTEATLSRLRTLLGCNDRDYYPETMLRGRFWVFKNYVRADHGPIPCHETVTYTTHAGFEFLDNVVPLVEHWMGPVSVAIHTPGSDLASAVDSIRYLRDCTGTTLVADFVTFHVFFPNTHIPSKIPDPETFLKTPFNCSITPPYATSAPTYKTEKNLLYPINVARNIAREAALTHYILPADIELYPSPDLSPRFLNMIARNEKPLNTSTKPRVFPISLFEIDKKSNPPWTKTDLQVLLANKSAVPFHKFVCPSCHNIPKGKQWMLTVETLQMEVFHVAKRQGSFQHWEPIFIGTHQDPYYDERLSWEGKKDKMTQAFILCVQDYEFMILNNAFLIHKPGIKKYVKDKKRDQIAARQSVYVNTVIVPELKKVYGTKTGCVL